MILDVIKQCQASTDPAVKLLDTLKPVVKEEPKDPVAPIKIQIKTEPAVLKTEKAAIVIKAEREDRPIKMEIQVIKAGRSQSPDVDSPMADVLPRAVVAVKPEPVPERSATIGARVTTQPSKSSAHTLVTPTPTPPARHRATPPYTHAAAKRPGTPQNREKAQSKSPPPLVAHSNVPATATKLSDVLEGSYIAGNFVWARSPRCPWFPALVVDPLTALSLPAEIAAKCPEYLQDILARRGRAGASSSTDHVPDEDLRYLVKYFDGTWDCLEDFQLAYLFEEHNGAIVKSQADRDKLAETEHIKKAAMKRSVLQAYAKAKELCTERQANLRARGGSGGSGGGSIGNAFTTATTATTVKKRKHRSELQHELVSLGAEQPSSKKKAKTPKMEDSDEPLKRKAMANSLSPPIPGTSEPSRSSSSDGGNWASKRSKKDKAKRAGSPKRAVSPSATPSGSSILMRELQIAKRARERKMNQKDESPSSSAPTSRNTSASSDVSDGYATAVLAPTWFAFYTQVFYLWGIVLLLLVYFTMA